MTRNSRIAPHAAARRSRLRGPALPLATATLLALIALAACSGNSNVPRAQLAGTWVLNESDSQSPDSVMRNGGEPTRAGRGGAGGVIGGGMGGGRGGMGGGRGGMGGGFGGRGGEGGRGGDGGRGGLTGGRGGNFVAMRNVMRVLAEERPRVSIIQTQDTVTFTFADDVPIAYGMTGKKMKRELPGLGEVETKAEWKDGMLVVERKLEDVKIRDEFVRGPESPRLIVNTTISGGVPRDLHYRTVYELQTG